MVLLPSSGVGEGVIAIACVVVLGARVVDSAGNTESEMNHDSENGKMNLSFIYTLNDYSGVRNP